jgi:hypothetical protein
MKDEIFIFSGRGIKADWFKNLIEDPDSVRVLIGLRARISLGC